MGKVNSMTKNLYSIYALDKTGTLINEPALERVSAPVPIRPVDALEMVPFNFDVYFPVDTKQCDANQFMDMGCTEFNPQDFCSTSLSGIEYEVKFQTILSTKNGGDHTAEVVLFNESTNNMIKPSLIRSSSVRSEFNSVSLSKVDIPNLSTIYSVRLRISHGHIKVRCKMARLRVTYTAKD